MCRRSFQEAVKFLQVLVVMEGARYAPCHRLHALGEECLSKAREDQKLEHPATRPGLLVAEHWIRETKVAEILISFTCDMFVT